MCRYTAINTHHNVPHEDHDQALRDHLPPGITEAFNCLSFFAIFGDGPDEASDGLLIATLALIIMRRMAAKDSRLRSLDEFKDNFRENSDKRITES